MAFKDMIKGLDKYGKPFESATIQDVRNVWMNIQAIKEILQIDDLVFANKLKEIDERYKSFEKGNK